MADVKGVFTRRLVTGYLITNYRCFVWDAEADVVKASVPVAKCELVVSNTREGARSRRGGSFMPSMPPTPPTESESEKEKGAEEDQTVTIGDISFMADGETIMVFRDVVEPERVKELVDGLRALGRSSSDDRVEAIVRAKQAR
jgi:hypothetical protein